MAFPSNKNVSGDIEFSFYAANYDIQRVEFKVQDQPVRTIENTDSESYLFQGTIVWNTAFWQNGIYTVRLSMFDHANNEVFWGINTLQVHNEWWSWSGYLSVFLVLALIFSYALILYHGPTYLGNKFKEKKISKHCLLCIFVAAIILFFSIILFSNSILEYFAFVDPILVISCLYFADSLLFGITYVCFTIGLQNWQEKNQSKTVHSYSTKDFPLIPHLLSVEMLLSRSDILVKTRSNLRTGIGILSGIGSGIAIWAFGNIESNWPPEVGYGLLFVAGIILAFSGFVGVIISFSKSSFIHGGREMLDGLLPRTIVESQYKEDLVQAIRKNESQLAKIRICAGTGILYFAILLLTGVTYLFFSTLLPPSGFSWVLALASSFVFTLGHAQFSGMTLGPDGLGIVLVKVKNQDH
jgi:hypothetical protein